MGEAEEDLGDRTRLSENFHDWEFRCRCGCGTLIVDPLLIDCLERLRSLSGDRPIHVLSGCRCREHNRAVGGAPKSQHLAEVNTEGILSCKAADIVIAGKKPRQMFRLARKIAEFDDGGIGIYERQGFIHVDVRGSKARWFVYEKGSQAETIPRNYY